MLVRLKKRGEFPDHTGCNIANKVIPGIGISIFKGCCIEVCEYDGRRVHLCSGQEFIITDSRVLQLFDEPLRNVLICEHFLIDDLNAYDSDSADEQAEVGDLAMAEVVRPVEVKR